MKTPSFILSPSASSDLNQIWGYLADDNIDAADRVIIALEKAMRRLGKTPAIGHFREDLADKRHRFFLVYSYLIVYRFQPKPIQVVRVLHASRDIQEILDMDSDVL